MSLVENKVKEVMQTGMKNMAKDHDVVPKEVQIIISRKKDDFSTPCYHYAVSWDVKREVNMTADLLRPTFGLDLFMREEIAKQFIPKKMQQIAKDYNTNDDENLKVIVMAQDDDLENLLLIPYYGNKQLMKDEKPVILPFEYIVEF